MPNISVLAVPVGQSPKRVEIDSGSLSDAYSLVSGGPLEMVPLSNNIYMWCNEEGKLTGLPINFVMVGDGGNTDPIMGDVFFSSDDGNGEIDTLSEDQEKILLDMFQRNLSAR